MITVANGIKDGDIIMLTIENVLQEQLGTS